MQTRWKGLSAFTQCPERRHRSAIPCPHAVGQLPAVPYLELLVLAGVVAVRRAVYGNRYDNGRGVVRGVAVGCWVAVGGGVAVGGRVGRCKAREGGDRECGQGEELSMEGGRELITVQGDARPRGC